MSTPYTKAPHQGGLGPAGSDSIHAALLIDFDNVTMGMRSDLSKELKTLLDSDVIKGKVSVQRAYADWRRYPQYIVPLSEASVDLIFAPAYGSNKKNATDIRMAIDALELVFIRPEIGTYILLTGDSDFSSLVLKLKEYGKYVIGVGIRESSSDILVQNCDEYYSYTSLTGLTKTTELTQAARDPWILVNEALKKMVSRGDVMRSDRLKQVMQELDPLFNERGMGFSKFSKFLAEASSRGLVALKKQENGQYEVKPPYRGRSSQDEAGDKRAPVRGQRQRSPKPRHSAESLDQPSSQGTRSTDDPLKEAYQLLVSVLEDFRTVGREPVRDSDLKRKMLKKNADFDEAELGFPKFSRFLVQATEHGVISTDRTERGNFEVSLPDSHSESEVTDDISLDVTVVEQETTSVVEVVPSSSPDSGLRLGPRRGSTRRRGGEDLPQLFEGQAAGTSIPSETDSATLSGEDFSASGIGLPTDPQAIVRYLAHRYKGVGQKTAETLVEQFGPALFQTLRDDPESVKAALPSNRGEQVLVAWKADYARRTSDGTKEAGNRGGRGRR